CVEHEPCTEYGKQRAYGPHRKRVGCICTTVKKEASRAAPISYVQIRRASRCLSRQCVSWTLNLSLIPRWRSRQKFIRLGIESRDSTLRRRSIRPGPFRWQHED